MEFNTHNVKINGRIMRIPVQDIETDEMYQARVEYMYETMKADEKLDDDHIISLSKMFLYNKYFDCEFKEKKC